MMMRCIAIDDEKLVRDLLEDNIRQIPYLHLVTTCKNALETIAVLQREPIDLMFLDIQMPGLNGLQLLRTLPQPPMVILVTAYSQYALDGFELQVIDYLLKPFSFERFLKACNQALHLHQLHSKTNAPTITREDEYFFVNVEYNQVKIILAEITYVEGLKDYIKIYLSTSEKPVLTRMTLKAMEEKLAHAQFVRTHKSYLVSIPHITAIKRDIVCVGKKEIPVGNLYKDQIEQLVNPSKN